MKIPKQKMIMGRKTKYVADPTLKDHGLVAVWIPQADKDHDLIKYTPGQSAIEMTQTILHEEFHAVLARVGFHQAKFPTSVEEILVESLSVFMSEHYKLAPKT